MPQRTIKKKRRNIKRGPNYSDSPPVHKPARFSAAEMKQILINRFGLKCWGCEFRAPRSQYLQLDHITPKSEGGSNALDNRALLCAPCNALKSNTLTLIGLRQENYKQGFSKTDKHPINIADVKKWAKKYLMEH